MADNQKISGKAWRLGNDIDTDVIIPGQYMNMEPEEYAKHALEPIEPDFGKEVNKNDVIVAEENFGIGSSREHAAIALKEAGIGAIIAVSYGRIFYRNAINQGIPVLKCERNVPDEISDGDGLEVEPFEGVIRNLTTGEAHMVEPISEPQRSILRAGGATEYYSKK